MTLSIGLLFPGSEILTSLLLDAHTFMEELVQRIRIQVSKYVREGKNAFVHNMYSLYQQTQDTILMFITTKRLHLTAWHLTPNQPYLAQQFLRLKKQLDTKENKFFLR